MTRTFFFQEVSEKHRAIYDVVLEANEAAEELVRPGVPLHELDDCARAIISRAGYGEYFTHRLGHFIGLDDHDFGDVSAAAKDCAVAGNIFSIEPGVYIEGEVGIRIEDLVLVTESGVERLNHYPKALEIVG